MLRVIVLTLMHIIVAVHSASIKSNEVVQTPRIHNSEELISTIVSECFGVDNDMTCLKGNLLTYLDTVLGLKSTQGRDFGSKNMDKEIYDRVSRILTTNELRVHLPKIIFGDVIASYRSDRGITFHLPMKNDGARGLLKKKLLFPVLLLLKLKMKALMPILVALIGLKAMKALILSKLAITIVLGFVIAQLVKKTGLGMPMMSMMPMASTEPMNTYGPPTTLAPPDTSYLPSAWEPNQAYSVKSSWKEPNIAASSQNLAYSSYYPAASGTSSSSINSGSPPSSISQSATPQAY